MLTKTRAYKDVHRSIINDLANRPTQSVHLEDINEEGFDIDNWESFSSKYEVRVFSYKQINTDMSYEIIQLC